MKLKEMIDNAHIIYEMTFYGYSADAIITHRMSLLADTIYDVSVSC